ncbi:hypothetical protein [Fundidesulfovibrio soli]|uniref:hypothetical protein n=1 Tax=Fundidesulfovibrio soli TaxID=2922716 RepID=UPI001FAE8C55|nr:hypothetical protein [Fundidesulfovibrio soli]
MAKLKILSAMVLFILGVVFVASGQGNPLNQIYCSVLLPVTRWSPSIVGFFSCSNVVQSKLNEFDRNLALEPQPDFQGYAVFTPLDASQPGVFRMQVKHDRQLMFFFPRMHGDDCRVEVYEVVDEYKRKLFTIRGDKSNWTPVAQRQVLNMGCTQDAVLGKVSDTVLEFVLIGKWAQIWTKDSAVLY